MLVDNFNLWSILIPAFVVEAIVFGYVTRDMDDSPITDTLRILVAIMNSVIIFVSIWHDSTRGIIQLAEDLSASNEDPMFAFGFIALGIAVLCCLFVGVQICLADFGAGTLPELIGKACAFILRTGRNISRSWRRFKEAFTGFFRTRSYYQITAQDIVQAIRSADQVDQTENRTSVVVSVPRRWCWSWRARS